MARNIHRLLLMLCLDGLSSGFTSLPALKHVLVSKYIDTYKFSQMIPTEVTIS
jgi:hypothetical protein